MCNSAASVNIWLVRERLLEVELGTAAQKEGFLFLVSVLVSKLSRTINTYELNSLLNTQFKPCW